MTSQKDPPILSLFHLRIASALTQHFTSSRLLFKHTSPPTDYIDKLEAPAEPPFFPGVAEHQLATWMRFFMLLHYVNIKFARPGSG